MKNSSIYKTSSGEKEIIAFYDSVLCDWPVPYKTKMLHTRQGDTFVIICGKVNAPALILLHGAASNASSWIGDVSAYSEQFRVIAPDLPGEPGKSANIRPSWQNLDFAEWLQDIYDVLKIDKAILVGISQGAWTALRFASFAPEKVEKLVLLTPAGIVPTKSSFILIAIIYSMLGKYGAKKLNGYLFGEQWMNPTLIEYMNLIMMHFKARIEKEYMFTEAELRKLNMSVLLIGGKDDVVRSCGKIAKRLSLYVPNLESRIIQDMGHVLTDTSQYVLPFLRNS